MKFLLRIELSHNAPKENPMKTVLIATLLTLAAPTLTIAATPIEAAIADPARTDKDRERDARENSPASSRA
jgi:hypothetical protein